MSQYMVGKRPFLGDCGRRVINRPVLGSRLKGAGCQEERGMLVTPSCSLLSHTLQNVIFTKALKQRDFNDRFTDWKTEP